ncbi:MAG: hypothetical protein Q9177_000418 [Variospora cf. flavescens]
MAGPVDHSPQMFPFFKLPAELRNMVYRHCLEAKEPGFEPQTFAAESANASIHFNLNFDTSVLQISRQMRLEASALLQDPLTLQIDINKYEYYKAFDIEQTAFVRQGSLRRALHYAEIMPLRRCEIKMVFGKNDNCITKLRDRSIIHQLTDTLQSFPAIKELRLQLLPWGSRPTYRVLSSTRLACFGQLRGFKKVEVTGLVETAFARVLERRMQRPRLSEGSEGSNNGNCTEDALFVCHREPKRYLGPSRVRTGRENSCQVNWLRHNVRSGKADSFSTTSR